LQRIEKLQKDTLSQMESAPGNVKAEGQQVWDRLDEVRKRLTADPGGYRSPAQIVDKINAMLRTVDSSPNRPTVVQSEWMKKYEKELEEVLAHLEKVVAEDVAKFNRQTTN
jgi:selenocysteine lyase/cysteine desulfurase